MAGGRARARRMSRRHGTRRLVGVRNGKIVFLKIVRRVRSAGGEIVLRTGYEPVHVN